jgi:hypothetical protein
MVIEKAFDEIALGDKIFHPMYSEIVIIIYISSDDDAYRKAGMRRKEILTIYDKISIIAFSLTPKVAYFPDGVTINLAESPDIIIS